MPSVAAVKVCHSDFPARTASAGYALYVVHGSVVTLRARAPWQLPARDWVWGVLPNMGLLEWVVSTLGFPTLSPTLRLRLFSHCSFLPSLPSQATDPHCCGQALSLPPPDSSPLSFSLVFLQISYTWVLSWYRLLGGPTLTISYFISYLYLYLWNAFLLIGLLLN